MQTWFQRRFYLVNAECACKDSIAYDNTQTLNLHNNIELLLREKYSFLGWQWDKNRNTLLFRVLENLYVKIRDTTFWNLLAYLFWN